MKKIYFSLLFITLSIMYYVHDDELKPKPKSQSISYTQSFDQLSGKKLGRKPAQARGGGRIKRLRSVEATLKEKSKKSQKTKMLPTSKYYKLKSMASFDSQGESFFRLKNAWAIPVKNYREGDFELITKAYSHVLVYSESRPLDAVEVLLNENDYLSVFTGILKVKLTDISLADTILSEVQYEITNRYENIRVVRFKFDSLEEAQKAKKVFSNHEAVQRVRLEILVSSRNSR